MNEIILAEPPGYVGGRDIYLPITATPAANQAADFYRLLVTDQQQQRTQLERCANLEQAAAWKAADIAQYDYWQHQASTGEWPNATARRFGCNLPPDYGADWNGVETLAAGSSDAMVMFNALAESPSHRAHLFGMNEFFRKQMHLGIAMATGGQWGWVWCVLIARCD